MKRLSIHLFMIFLLCVNASAQVSEESTPSSRIPDYVTRIGEKYYCQGQYMDKTGYANFLSSRCEPAYLQFTSGLQLAEAGWGLFGSGVAIGAIGIGFCFGIDAPALENIGTVAKAGLLNGSYACMAIGSALALACIPTLIFGYNRMHISVDSYNKQCSSRAYTSIDKKKTPTYWSISTSASGVGLAYNF